MIGKILPHQESFGPLSTYLLFGRDRQSPDRVEWVALRNLNGATPETAHVIMQATAQQSNRVKKPRQHVIVSWAHEDRPSDEQMVRIMDQTLADLGLSQHQAMLVAHNDTQHKHVHAIINRVHPDTRKTAKDGNERWKLRRSLVRQELQFGLIQTPLKSKGNYPQRVFSEIEIAKRQGTDEMLRFSKERCFKLKKSLEFSFKTANGWASLEGMLRRRGYRIVMAGRGIRITRGIHYAKLSDVLPPKIRAKQLTQRWGSFSAYWMREYGKQQNRKRQRKQKYRTQQKQI